MQVSPVAANAALAEIAALVELLHATDRKLDKLLGGEVDSVTSKSGETMVLRRAQGELRTSDNLRREAIIDALPAHLAMLDSQGVILSVNQLWRDFGIANGLLSTHDCVGLNYLDICEDVVGNDDSGRDAAAGIRSVLSGALNYFCMEYPCHSPRSNRWFMLSVTPLSLDDLPLGAVVMHTNITESREAGDALAALSQRTVHRERMFTTMLSSIKDFVYIFDSEARLVFANQPILDLLQLSIEEVEGKNFFDLGYSREDASMLTNRIQDAFRLKTGAIYEVPFILKAAQGGFYEHLLSPVFTPDGEVEYVVGVTRDITERRRMYDALRDLNADLEMRVATRTAELARQEALFRTLADQAPAVYWTLDRTGACITYLNRAGLALLGGCQQDWLGKSIESVIHPDDRAQALQEKSRGEAAGVPFVSVRRLRAANGVFHTMSCRASPVLDSTGAIDFWVGLEIDITEMNNMVKALKTSNREMAAFSYSVAHDLRSPLTVIAGFGRLLEKELGKSATARAVHLLTRMQAGVKQMDEVSEGLLVLAGLSHGAIKLGTTNLSKIARNVADTLVQRYPDRRVKLEIQDGLVACCDSGMLHALLSNLLGNAWKFTSKRDVAEIAFFASRHQEGSFQETIYSVQDNGDGFDMSYAGKLFQPFQRLHSGSEFEGTGIGLATVHKIVERHGGWIDASAVPGEGARFNFSLGKSHLVPPVGHI